MEKKTNIEMPSCCSLPLLLVDIIHLRGCCEIKKKMKKKMNTANEKEEEERKWNKRRVMWKTLSEKLIKIRRGKINKRERTKEKEEEEVKCFRKSEGERKREEYKKEMNVNEEEEEENYFRESKKEVMSWRR